MSASKQDLTVDALGWINDELAEIFASAGRALERFESDTSDRAALTDAAKALHSATGALHMVEVHGAALLTEEMVKVTRALGDQTVTAPAEALEALSRALLQAPVYLERVARGGHDIPLILLPLLNDLRTTRGHPLLSESSLFVLNADRAGVMPPRPPEARQVGTRTLAHQLRGAYQASLLNWLRSNEPAAQLATLADIARQFREAATTPLVFQTWWVLGGIVEAIVDGGLRPTASIKRLLGQGDRMIKYLAANGENREKDRDVAEGFLNNLLYYVGRATSRGEQVTAIRKAYGLQALKTIGEQPADTDALAAPSVNLMKTVGEAIRQDLADVKDAIDIHVRTGVSDRGALAPQCDALTKVADTLRVLGLPEIGRQMSAQSEVLSDYAGGSGDDDTLLAIASVLIQCEKGLEEQLVQRTIAPADDAIGQGASAQDVAEQSDQRDVVDAVLRECIFNLTKIKDSLSQLVMRPDHGGSLDEVPGWLRGIEAGLLMLEKPRAKSIVGDIGWHVQQLRARGLSHLGGDELDRLADAIVSVEYFMETVRKGRRDPDYMLDNALSCLGSLSKQPPTEEERAAAEEASATGSVPVMSTTATDLPVMTLAEPAPADPPRPNDQDASNLSQPGAPLDGEAFVAIEALDTPVLLDGRTQRDPELLELFIEEAKEEIGNLDRQLPRWRANVDQRERLLSIRRSYHTLKGSGRMVGARIVAEFCWTLESLLNAVIDGAMAVSEDLHELLAEAQKALPALIEQLEAGAPPAVDVNALIRRAAALRDGRDVLAAIAGDEAAEAPAAPESEPGALELDPVLLDIFRNESQGHLQTIDEFVERGRQSGVPQPVPESLHRAWHTLRGSANMAAVQPIVDLATPLNEHLRTVMHEGGALSQDALSVLGDAAGAVRGIVASINTGKAPADAKDVATRIEALVQAQVADVPPASPPAKVESEAPADAEGFDPEVAAIFADEAEELLGACDPAVDQWLADASATGDALPELLRHLHTLKGGARMAGIAPMATLSHELESVFEAFNVGELEVDDEARDVIRLGFDRLHMMQEALAGQTYPAAANDVIEQLKGLGDGSIITHIDDLAARRADVQRAAAEQAQAERAEAERAEAERAEAERAEAERAEAERAAAERAAAERAAAERAAAERAAAERAEAERAAAERAAAERAEAERAAAERAEAERAAAERAEAERAAAERAAAERAEAERAEAERAAAERAAAERAAAERAAAERAAAERAAAERAEAERAAAAARRDVASMASEMAQLVEELGDVSPAPSVQAEEAFASRLAAATQAGRAPEGSGVSARATRDSGTERPTEVARIDARVLDELLNNAGEVSIFQSRIEQEIGSIRFNLTELSQTVARLRDQLRQLDVETEAQIRFGHQDEAISEQSGAFDPLELDRYSTIQQLSRALGESVSDLVSLQELLSELTRESENLLTQQSRVTTELQDSLIRTRMLPFASFTPRLERVVRSAARDMGKRVKLSFSGATGELDRQVLQRMMPAFEHLLRNAVAHGIEEPAQRRAAGKSETGVIRVVLRREGTEMAIDVCDDGAGLNIERIRRIAIERGLLDADRHIDAAGALSLILSPGFSTAAEITQDAGRGVGMDVVANEIKLLGGSLSVDSRPGQGTAFTARLPLTLAVTQALLVRCGEDQFAIPLPAVEGIVRVPRRDVDRYRAASSDGYVYGDQTYRVEHLGRYVGASTARLDVDDNAAIALVLVRAGEHSTALIVDEMLGSREVVVKAVGPLVSGIPGMAGATILGDGSIVMILDAATLVRRGALTEAPPPRAEPSDSRPLILVVDDSITVRRVTQRLLERHDMRVMTAKDGLDAVTRMADTVPDLVLLDIEMPRMDGYEVTTHIRNSDQLRHLPIIMVTSRTGDKHRARAYELGVDGYLGKPYQEAQLLDTVRPLLADGDAQHKRSGR